MGTTKQQRQYIETSENLMALISSLDERFRILAAHQRQPHLLREIAQGRAELQRMADLIYDERQRLHKEAGG